MSGYKFRKARANGATCYAHDHRLCNAQAGGGSVKNRRNDYLPKPFAPEELLRRARCAERYRLLQENAHLRARAGDACRLEQIVGECAKFANFGN
jgi:hypothetical protein